MPRATPVVPPKPRRRKSAIDTVALQQAIFESANFSSIATDATGVIQIFNVGAERMLGYSASEVTNTITPAEMSDPQELITRAAALSQEAGTTITPGFEALVFKASRGIEDIYELTYIRKDRSRVPAIVSVTALRDVREKIIGYLIIGTDNTARKQVEAERERLAQNLRDQNAELEVAKREAEEANAAKSDFLSSMSHELRSPLNAILGFAQLMDSDTTSATPSQKASIGQILHAGWYLLELINEILDLAVIESGKLSLSLEPVSVAEVMPECEAIVEQQAVKRSITVTYPRWSLPHFIRADRTRLKQVLINLLSNAIKYNRPGGSVVVECTVVGTRTRLTIRDTGLGLSPPKLALLFQPFNRLGRETTGEEGTGIGLVMSKLLVELMGGVIGVESEVGVGSVFWFELDSSQAPSLRSEETEAQVRKQARPVASDVRTVLYVEDNVANLQLVEQLIARRSDLRLLTAVTGRSGVELARSEIPDVILMDINLPGISGLQALEMLLADPLTSHIPVVAISANAMRADVKRGLDAGFMRYLTKPIKVNEFNEALNLALEVATRRRSGA